jgi:hypothetical protein
MRSVFFGLGLQYDSGDGPCIAINNSGRVVEVHKNELGLTIYYRTGQVKQMTVDWSASSHELTGGVDPSVALNNSGRVVEVHKNEAGITLYSSTGTANGDGTISWNSTDDYTSGITPSVALNDAGQVVEVHRSEKTTRLYYRYGTLGSSNVDWEWDDNYDNGQTPKVAINNNGDVVEVHQSEFFADLFYFVGKINEDDEKIDFGSSQPLASGLNPSVALNDNGDVIVAWSKDGLLWQRFGKINTSSKIIDWTGDAKEYESGATPSVATSNSMAIEAHEGAILQTLWSSTSIITDRAIWMTERRVELGSRTIPQLVLPASHDSAMYLDGLSVLGKTQYISIFDQLEYGIRYFDLRPEKSGDKIIIHHGPIAGPDLSVVLADIRSYCQFGHKELIILDWGEFTNFNATDYQAFVNQVNAAIGSWQFKGPLQSGQRLGNIPLATYTQNGPCIISAIADNWAVNNPQAGFWIYRKCDDADSNIGDLVVYDYYSDTTSYDTMRDDQLWKFDHYTGKQKNFPTLPCDIFLLSWTCTPITGVWFESVDPNRNLGNVIAEVTIPNTYGQIMNALYVDYCEYARVTDVGIIQNNVQSASVVASPTMSIRKESESAENAAADVIEPGAPLKQPTV